MSKVLKLTPAQEAFVKGLDKESKAEFDALDREEQMNILELQVGIVADVKKLDGTVKLAEVGYTDDGAKIISLGKTEGKSSLNSLRAGSKVIARFMGIDYIFSNDEKPNWERVTTADGKEVKWRSEFFRFKRENGTEFGIFSTAMLRNALRTLITNSSSPALVNIDPMVEIQYHGLVTPEVAKKDFGFVTNLEEEIHAVKVMKEKDALENLEAGIHNYLRSPIPAGKINRDDLTKEESELISYNNMKKANELATRAATTNMQ